MCERGFMEYSKIYHNVQHLTKNNPIFVSCRVDPQTILKKLQSKIDGNICPTANQINVFRENILQCSLQAVKRRRFNPQAKSDVVFVDAEENGEGAIDEGGPTREYLRAMRKTGVWL